MNNNEAINESYSLHKLESITSGDEQAIRHFNRVFLNETLTKDVSSLRKFYDERNMSELNRCAHKMKSSLDLYCLNEVAGEIRVLEHLTEQGSHSSEMSDIITRVERSLFIVREQFTQLI
ncbi:MAG: hypothetical protein KDC12_04060 [Flavobacteriales bacterium]|nr:hypothetical protein [Flavobacteriales bacterium]